MHADKPAGMATGPAAGCLSLVAAWTGTTAYPEFYEGWSGFSCCTNTHILVNIHGLSCCWASVGCCQETSNKVREEQLTCMPETKPLPLRNNNPITKEDIKISCAKRDPSLQRLLMRAWFGLEVWQRGEDSCDARCLMTYSSSDFYPSGRSSSRERRLFFLKWCSSWPDGAQKDVKPQEQETWRDSTLVSMSHTRWCTSHGHTSQQALYCPP